MYERTYGYLYDRDRLVKDDAANIRRHLKTMQKAGVLPADVKFTVRYRTYSGGCSIDVAAEIPRPIYAADPMPQDWVKHAETGDHVIAWKDRLTLEAGAVLDAMQELVNAHNHDGSDTQTDYFDVKFYGVPTVSPAPGVPRYVAPVSS